MEFSEQFSEHFPLKRVWSHVSSQILANPTGKTIDPGKLFPRSVFFNGAFHSGSSEKIPSLKLTASLPLKMDGWNFDPFLLGGSACFRGRLLLVFGSVVRYSF